MEDNESEMEETQETLDLSIIPIRALSMSSRQKLTELLMPKLALSTSSGLIRDYRGLFQLMQFSNSNIDNLVQTSNPVKEALKIWGTSASANVESLLNMFSKMEREDILEDIKPFFEADAHLFLRSKNKGSLQPFEGPSHITPIANNGMRGYTVSNFEEQDFDEEEEEEDELEQYNAYICYCDKDLPFATFLVEILEQFGLKFFLRERDELPGRYKLDLLMTLLTKKCSRVFLILSPDFLQSPEYKRQLKIISGLAAEKEKKMLIPILYKACAIPEYTKLLSKVDFTEKSTSFKTAGWAWNKLGKVLGIEIPFPTQQYMWLQNGNMQLNPSIQSPISFQSISSTQANQSNLGFPQLMPHEVEPSSSHFTSEINDVSQQNRQIMQNGSSSNISLSLNTQMERGSPQPPKKSSKKNSTMKKKITSFFSHIIPIYSKESTSFSVTNVTNSEPDDKNDQAKT